MVTDASPRPSTRRSLVLGSMAAGAVGGAWFTGLTTVARGFHPQILAIGDDGWVLLLIEHRLRRILLMVGETADVSSWHIMRLLGAWRYGVDVLAGTSRSLSEIDLQTRQRLAPVLTLALDSDDSLRAASRQAIGTGVRMRCGAIAIDIAPAGGANNTTWIAHLRVDDIAVAIAPSLTTVAEHGDATTVLGMAPTGDIATCLRILPQIAIATNQSNATASAPAIDRQAGAYLVRIFPSDVARMVFRGDRLRLPTGTRVIEPL